VKELKAFEKFSLAPGEEKIISFGISVNDLKFFDDKKHEWIAEPGKFTVYIGASSADIRSTIDFTLTTF
jgi:beta-glucosidase